MSILLTIRTDIILSIITACTHKLGVWNYNKNKNEKYNKI